MLTQTDDSGITFIFPEHCTTRKSAFDIPLIWHTTTTIHELIRRTNGFACARIIVRVHWLEPTRPRIATSPVLFQHLILTTSDCTNQYNANLKMFHGCMSPLVRWYLHAFCCQISNIVLVLDLNAKPRAERIGEGRLGQDWKDEDSTKRPKSTFIIELIVNIRVEQNVKTASLERVVCFLCSFEERRRIQLQLVAHSWKCFVNQNWQGNHRDRLVLVWQTCSSRRVFLRLRRPSACLRNEN